MKVSYDQAADTIYIKVKAAKVKKTKKIQINLLVDFDAKDKVSGVKIFNASRWLESGD